MKRWITFDLDGTLMQNPFGRWVFPELTSLIAPHVKEPEYQLVKELVSEHEIRMREGRTVEAYDWDDIVRVEAAKWGVQLDINVEQMVIKHSQVPRIHLLDDTIVKALSQLKEKGLSLAVVTNGFYKYQYPVLSALGIGDIFDEIVTPERRGCAKPDLRILGGLMESGRIAAHVGDRLDHDIIMANAAGIPSVWVNRSLPESLNGLSPHERAADDQLRAILEQKLAAEKVELADSDGLAACQPDYVIREIGELVHLDEPWKGAH